MSAINNLFTIVITNDSHFYKIRTDIAQDEVIFIEDIVSFVVHVL